MSTPASNHSAWGVSVLLILGLVATGCTTTPAARGPVVAPEIVSTGLSAAIVDAEPIHTTDDLLPVSEIGFIGVVESFSQGVMAIDGQSFDFRPVVARVTSVDVFHGTAPSGEERSVYLALPGTATPDDYARSIPVGTRLIAYANSLPIGSEVTVTSGVPDGAPVFTIVHPAGFALETALEGRAAAAFPLAGATVAEMTLEQLLPGNEAPKLEPTYEELYGTPAP